MLESSFAVDGPGLPRVPENNALRVSEAPELEGAVEVINMPATGNDTCRAEFPKAAAGAEV